MKGERGDARLHCFYDFFFRGVVGLHVLIENLNELCDYSVAFQRGEQTSIHIDRRLRLFESSRKRDAKAGMF